MSDLIIMVYPTVARAEVVRQRLIELQKEYLIALDDAVVVTRTESGSIRLDQLVNATAAGAISGSFWGLLIGVLFLSSVAGAALGGASSALADSLSDVGLNGLFIKKLSARLQPGYGALFLLVKLMTTDNVLREIRSFGGVMLKTSLDESKEEILRDALQVATATETSNGAPIPERVNDRFLGDY